MSDPFVAEIRMFGFDYAPQGWAFCNGALLPISQNTALFSLLGVTYGGNGQSTFGLPDFRGRAPTTSGQGSGLSNYPLGAAVGTEKVTLLAQQMPAHNHTLTAYVGSGTQMTDAPASGSFLGRTLKQFDFTNTGSANTTLGPQSISPAGGSQPHTNQQPYLVMNFCIALQGIFPPRA